MSSVWLNKTAQNESILIILNGVVDIGVPCKYIQLISAQLLDELLMQQVGGNVEG